MTNDEYQELVTEERDLQSQVDRCKGELQRIQKQLKEEFGVDTLAEAQTFLTRLRKEEAKKVAAYEKLSGAFIREWGEKLDELAIRISV